MSNRFIPSLLFPLCCIVPLLAYADDVDDYISASMARQHIPGLSLVVLRDDQVIKAKGYGLSSVELNVPARPETVYELASATKPFVATAVMLLVQDGKIGLDDPLSKYLKEVTRYLEERHRSTPADAHVGHQGLPRRLAPGLPA